MTALGTAVKYQTPVIAVVPYAVDIDWAASTVPSEATDTKMYAHKLLSWVLVGENTSESVGSSANRLLRAELMGVEQTKENERWPGADWPAAQAFEDAYMFISCLPLATIPVPEVSLAEDGEINFLWSHDGVYVDLGFYGTGTFSYHARGRDGAGLRDENVPASEGLPVKITALFTA